MSFFKPAWQGENREKALKDLKKKQFRYSENEVKEIAKNARLSEVRMEALKIFNLDNETERYISCNDENPLVRDMALERIIKKDYFTYPGLEYVIEHSQHEDVRHKAKMVFDERKKRDAENEEWRQANPSKLTCDHDWAGMTVDDPWNYHYRCTKCRKQKSEPR